MSQHPLQPGRKVKPKNYAQPMDGYQSPVPIDWRIISYAVDGRAVVQVTMIAYCSYDPADLELGATG